MRAGRSLTALISIGLLGILWRPALAGTRPLLSDSMSVSVGQYRYLQIRIQPYEAEGTTLRGSLEVQPDSFAVELILLHIDDFVRWRRSLPDVDTLHYERLSSGQMEIPVDGFGDLVLVMSNRGNLLPVAVSINLELSFAGRGMEVDPLYTALIIALVLIAVALITFLVFALFRRGGSRRRN